MPPKRIAFLVFPRLTLLDFIGAYDALRRVASMSIDQEVTHRVIGTDAEIVDETGLKITPDSVYEDLSRFDLLYVAGGLGTVTLMDNKRAIDYLKTWGDERPLASVCSGCVPVGGCGFFL
jgi:transcriptional regulator GlxA family with amidase domain